MKKRILFGAKHIQCIVLEEWVFGFESLYGNRDEVITRLFYGNVEQERFLYIYKIKFFISYKLKNKFKYVFLAQLYNTFFLYNKFE